MGLDGLRVRGSGSFTFAEADRLVAVSPPGAWGSISAGGGRNAGSGITTGEESTVRPPAGSHSGWAGVTAEVKRNACFLMLNAMQETGLFGSGTKRENRTFYCLVQTGPARLPCQGGLVERIDFTMLFGDPETVRLGAVFPTMRVGAAAIAWGRWRDYPDPSAVPPGPQSTQTGPTDLTVCDWFSALIAATMGATSGGSGAAAGGTMATVGPLTLGLGLRTPGRS
jgi:hypothetical protein